MADPWFIRRDGQQFGPYSPAQLRQMTATGELLPVDLVSKGGGGRWVPASQIKGLFAAAPVAEPPPLPVPRATTEVVPPPVPASAFDFGGPLPLPATPPPGGTTVEAVDGKAVVPTNPVAMALLSGLILIPVGHIIMGQVLKAVAVLFVVPWLLVAVISSTGGAGYPVVALAYAAVMGTDAYLLALRRSAGEPVGPWDTPVVGRLLGAKGLLPARVALPVLGMLAVLGAALVLSLFGVKEAVTDTHDLRFQLLVAFALLHSVLGVAANVLTVRLQHSVAGPAAAVLTMTVFGWYVFALGWPIVWILGLMAGVSVGAWALWTFRSPDVRALFADADRPGPLDRFGVPALAGAGGGLLAAILCVGGLLYVVARDKTSAGSSPAGSGGAAGNRLLKERTTRSRSGSRQGKGADVFNEWVADRGEPDETHTFPNAPYLEVYVWSKGGEKYDCGMINYAGGFGNLKTNVGRRSVEYEIEFCQKVR